MLEYIEKHYNLGNETNRIQGMSLERLRTESILSRYLPEKPAIILDIGGADGVYAFSLASQGYHVHLVDPIELHIKQAFDKNKSASASLKSIELGDARKLNFADESADVILSFGPFYHLQEKVDRILALKEAYRVLKPGGLLLTAHISQFTSFIDGIRGNYFQDSNFVDIVKEDLLTGRHHNPTNHPAYFTSAFFQHPYEAKNEVSSAGFSKIDLLSIEGPIWMIQGMSTQLSDPKQRELILHFLQQIERDETIVGASSHYAVIAKK